MRINPLTRQRLQRFRSMRRGYWSAVLLAGLLLAGLLAELWVNHRALVVFDGERWHFPTYGEVIPGSRFGLDYDHETNYRELAERFANDGNPRTWVWLPPVPWGPLESDLVEEAFPPHPPSLARRHLLGTDTVGRDVLARLVYGFRTAMLFSLALLGLSYAIGVALGCIMGYVGGRFDLYSQRLIEIWSNIPTLYVIMIVASVIPPGFWSLLGIMVFFGWTAMTWYMRTATYRENARDYVLAARALGAGPGRLIFRHILPNTVSTLITFVPFSIAGGITALTALDYLGFGLPPPTPSWGELLKQGTDNLESAWIVASVVGAMTLVLILVTFIGEAIREAFDPRRFSYYR